MYTLFAFLALSSQALTSTVTGKIELDGHYPAMAGPTRGYILPLALPSDSTELWVTGVRLEAPARHICHSRLGLARVQGLDPDSLKMGREEDAHNKKYDIEWFLGNSQGNLENRLPPGFGIRLDTKRVRRPVYTVQFQNEESGPPPRPFEVKVQLFYHSAQEARRMGLKPLHGFGFPIVERGRRHWAVPPGRHRYRTGVRFFAGDRPKFKIHYIQPHAHAYTNWIELADVTAGTTLWRGYAKTDAATASLTSVETYSDADGIEIDTSHTFEVRSEYDNPTPKAVDAMILMKVYADAEATTFLDQAFKRKNTRHAHHH